MSAVVKGLACLLLLCATTLASLAADKAIIVLDASGSMWGQIGGTPKLEIARETLAQVLATIPADLELGFMAYGHREKGNCSDIELLVPPAAGTAGAIEDAAAQLHFLGKTPLSEAVRQAAEALRYTEEKATVILITDGIETCEADPCELGNELESTGVDFTAHVVGFGLTRDEGRQVACLAENTGGRYIQAGNAGELKEALTETVAAPKAEKPKPVELPPASVSTEDRPSIGRNFSANWTGPAADGDYLDVVAADDREIGKELSYAYVATGQPLQIRAPGQPGSYDLRYIWEGPDKRHVLAVARIEVTDADVALVGPATVMVGQSFDLEWKGPDTPGDYIDIVPPDHMQFSGELSYQYTSNGNPAQMRAPADVGDYKIRYVLDAPEGRKLLTSVPLKVTAATASVAFPTPVVVGADLDVNWTGPKGQGDYVDLVPSGYKETSGEISYFYIESSSDGETGVLKVAGDPGVYDVRYVLQAPNGRRVVTSQQLTVIAASAALEFTGSVVAGADLDVRWTGPAGRGDYVDLVPAGYKKTDGELSYFYIENALDEQAGKLKVAGDPGAYLVRYVLQAGDGRRVIAAQPLTVVAASATLKARESVETGTEFAVEWSGPNGDGDYIDLVPAGYKQPNNELAYFYTGNTVEEHSGTLRAPDKPGRYDIRYVLAAAGGRKVIARVSLDVQ